MGQGRILNSGARAFGGLVCAVLGLISLAWIIRDLDKADEASHLWWTWSGLPFRATGGIFGSSLLDLVLLLVYAVVGLTALSSPAAGGALGTVAVVTVAVRLPSLWNLNSDWLQGIPDGLKTRANLSAWAQVVLAGLLLVVVAAARRPAGLTPPGYPVSPGSSAPSAPGFPAPPGSPVSPADRPPGRPSPGAAVIGALFLGAAGVVIAAWQIYWAQARGWEVYKYALTGKHTLPTLLSPPGGWNAWTAVALCLAAAGAAFARAPLARPLGMTAAALVMVGGISEASLYVKLDYVEHLSDLSTLGVLSVLSGFFEAVAGLIALTALARRGVDEGAVGGVGGAPFTGPPGMGTPAYGGAPAYGAYGGHDGYDGYGDRGAYGGHGAYGDQGAYGDHGNYGDQGRGGAGAYGDQGAYGDHGNHGGHGNGGGPGAYGGGGYGSGGYGPPPATPPLMPPPPATPPGTPPPPSAPPPATPPDAPPPPAPPSPPPGW
ncbi:hypothetical protein [Streptomyces hygroscopicus]|uniref:hypothetical protein n=1 Tax=Streptomyces hygroscopicus TaxID=1912 RepID=UPI00056C1FA8|nr:hypothetical protein [Streptomyces hygroscopicus]